MSWKTTLSGVAAILAAISDLTHQAATGQWDVNRLMTDAIGITTGIGLIFAKDHNK